MTNELYDVLYDTISPVVPNLYRNKAQTGIFPYATIKIDTMTDSYPTHDYSLVIAFYNKDSESIKPLETQADNVIALLNNKVIESNGTYYHFTLSLRQFINSEYLVGTQAIEIQLLARTYSKGE